MTQAVSTEAVYDPQRPWLNGPDEDPKQANWLAEYFNPGGRSSKPVFLRGQILLWIPRLFVVLFVLVASGAAPVPAGSAFFIFMLLLLIPSIIGHIRRLNDSGRSPFWAGIICLPLLVSYSLIIVSMSSIPARVATYEAKVATEQAAAEKAGEEGAEASDDAETSKEVADDAEDAPPQRRERPVTQSGLLGGAIGMGLNVWMLLSFGTMLFSLLFVARGPRRPPEEPRFPG